MDRNGAVAGTKVAEDEVKLGAPASFSVPDLDGALAAATAAGDGPRPSVVDLGERRLTATYWDTSDLRLTRSGISLRHRTAGDGSERGWTVKLPEARGGSGGSLHRSEVAYAGPEAEPPADATRLVAATTRGRPLSPVARLLTVRRRSHVIDGEGRVALELADDEVSVLDGDAVASRFRELEVEVAPGDHDGATLLPLVVQALQDAGAGAADPTPKIARALGARARSAADVVVPEIGRKATAGDVVRAAIATGTRRLVDHDPGVRLGGDDEDVHQARVATRRLRSDLATFRSLLDAGWVAEIRAELAWIAGELGAVRDADVLADRLRRQAAQLGKADGVAAASLLRSLETERAKARSRAGEALDTPRYAALVDQLVGASQAPPLTEAVGRSAAKAVPDLVGRAWTQLSKAVDRANASPSDALLHEVRKKAKRCRYACEAVVSVAGRDAAKLGAATAGVQEVLGDLQDAAVAELWLRSHTIGKTGAAASGRAFAAGLLTAVQQQAAAEARRDWELAFRAASAKRLRAWLR